MNNEQQIMKSKQANNEEKDSELNVMSRMKVEISDIKSKVVQNVNILFQLLYNKSFQAIQVHKCIKLLTILNLTYLQVRLEVQSKHS